MIRKKKEKRGGREKMKRIATIWNEKLNKWWVVWGPTYIESESIYDKFEDSSYMYEIYEDEGFIRFFSRCNQPGCFWGMQSEFVFLYPLAVIDSQGELTIYEHPIP